MARYNEILVGRFARAVQKLFGVKGEVPLGSLSGELVVVHGLFNGAENRYLEGWDRFGAATSVAAAAGFVSGIRLRNPSGSNVMVTMEKVHLAVLTANQINLTLTAQTADLASVASGVGRFDSRGRQASGLVLSNQNTTASIAGQVIAAALLNNLATFYDFILFEDQEFPLLPGDALTLITNSANVSLLASFMWRERALEESERA